MPLADAILALRPVLYWKLDEPAGATTVHDYVDNFWTGTVSGTISFGEFGPETDTTAARVYSPGLIQSAPYNKNTWTDFAVQFMASAPANGNPTLFQTVLGLGDPTNENVSWRFLQLSSSANNLQFREQNAATNYATVVTNAPTQNWHLYTFVYTVSPASQRLWCDTVPGTNIASTIAVAPLSTWRWYIQSPYPILLSHFAVYTHALTQTDINTVAAQVQSWPYTAPINAPPPDSGGGGGGLTPDEAATLDRIDTTTQTIAGNTDDIPGLVDAANFTSSMVNTINGKVDQLLANWAGYESVTLPSLQDMLNSISDAVHAVIDTAAGAVETTVGQLLSQPSADATSDHPLVISTCEPIDLDVSFNALYGVTLRVETYPEDTVFRTPDHAWTYYDLAVITFVRGGEVIERHGIHTLSHSVSPIPGSLPFGAGAVTAWLQPGDYHIRVDWKDGVCGSLTGAILP